MFRRDWFIPQGVHIAMTDRHGGVSLPPYDSLNLGTHVGDDSDKVFANRDLLMHQLGLPSTPIWLEQIHGTNVVCVDGSFRHDTAMPIMADGCYTKAAGKVCVVMTADCLPILLCNQAGSEVSALHAGWRGLCDGVIEQGVACFTSPSQELIAYLGPAIGPNAFEVGAEVRAAFMNKDIHAADCFVEHGSRYLASLEQLAIQRLAKLGINQVYCANTCTFSSPDYFSYRRDKQTGRLASLIWIENH